jgi:hypothetical protein
MGTQADGIDEKTQRLLQKYTPILMERHAQKSGAGNGAKE